MIPSLMVSSTWRPSRSALHALVPGVSQVEAVGDLPELFRHERDVMFELLLNVLHTGEELYGFPQVGLLPDGVRPFL